MGYYTSHNLIEPKRLTSDQIEKLERMSEYSDECIVDGYECKWYSFREDISTFSKLYPTQLFGWHCQGEEDEPYRVFVRNGIVEDIPAKITYDEPTI